MLPWDAYFAVIDVDEPLRGMDDANFDYLLDPHLRKISKLKTDAVAFAQYLQRRDPFFDLLLGVKKFDALVAQAARLTQESERLATILSKNSGAKRNVK